MNLEEKIVDSSFSSPEMPRNTHTQKKKFQTLRRRKGVLVRNVARIWATKKMGKRFSLLFGVWINFIVFW